MKILTRLSKEGSSADEPLNIPLSDYSRFEHNFELNKIYVEWNFWNFSDEGDSSSSSDDEGKDSFCDLEGPCCQALRVPPCSPILSPKKQAGVKKKVFTNKSSSDLWWSKISSPHRPLLKISNDVEIFHQQNVINY